MTGVKTELVRDHATKETFTPTSDIPRSTVQSAIEYVRSLITGLAPSTADYLVKTADSGLSAERVVTDGTSITADWATPGQVTFKRAALTGDVVASADANSTTIANNAVSDAKLRDSAAVSVIGRSANSSGDPADIAAAGNDTILRRVADALGFGQLTAGMFPANVVADAALRQSGSTCVIGRSAGTTGDVADITATTNDTLLRRVSDALSWGTLTIGMFGANLVTFAKLQQISTARFLGRTTASTGDIEELTGTQATAMLNNFVGDSGSGGTKGLVPAPAAGDAAASKFLKADGTWAVGGGFTAATQAEQETGTSTTVGVTPGRQHYHKSAAKMHAILNGTGTPAFIASNSNFNAASITDGGTGVWDINFTTALSAAAMCVVGCGDGRDAFLFFTRGDALATTSARFSTMNGAFSPTDCQYVHGVVFGDHS